MAEAKSFRYGKGQKRGVFFGVVSGGNDVWGERTILKLGIDPRELVGRNIFPGAFKVIREERFHKVGQFSAIVQPEINGLQGALRDLDNGFWDRLWQSGRNVRM
jgi:hypothetical protein